MDSIRPDVKSLLLDALGACHPARLVREQLEALALEDTHPVYLLAAGKASASMAEGVLEYFGGGVKKGLVINQDKNETIKNPQDVDLNVIRAEHPLPGDGSLEAGKAAVEFIRNLPGGEEITLICGISGGASSMLCLPIEGLSAADLRGLYAMMNNSGMTIHEINAVRKHLSRIKGGQLLWQVPEEVRPNIRWIDLLISDVPGDDPSVIGSGPTVPDRTTFRDACRILQEYGLWEQVPPAVRSHIEEGLTGTAQETLKPGEDPLEAEGRHETHIAGSAAHLAREIARRAGREGYHTLVHSQAYSGDVEMVADMIAGQVKETAAGKGLPALPAALIFYGEGTVNVKGAGKGGRNQHLALHAALKIDGMDSVTWLSAGTDGVDGPTDAAGAVVDGDTIRKAKDRGLNPEAYLAGHDSYAFHEKTGTLLKTGPTGNNVMDVQLVVVEQ